VVRFFSMALLAAALICPGYLAAQEAPAADASAVTPVAEEPAATPVEQPASAAGTTAPAPAPAAAEQAVQEQQQVVPISLRPLLFTMGEYTALQQAKSYRGMVRPPTEDELKNSLLPPVEKAKPPPEEREIKLGGIVYKSAKDWTIWLNGERVTPGALPKEALDLKVRENYIEIKWFDEYTNQIFPLRLRPHQRFNIDTRIFLPG
jgi:hypothetical protein